MSLFSFIKDAGAAVFGSKPEEQTEASKTNQLIHYLKELGFDVNSLRFKIEGETVTLQGEAPSHEYKEKLIVAVGNAKGVAHVEDAMRVSEATSAVNSKLYTVKSGDSLSKIAKEVYGDVNQYDKIFEANKPMLKHPDKIFPGQVLRIPA